MSVNHYKAMCEALGKSEQALNAESATLHMAAAQVHATAHAGEQARIGNLIAYVSLLDNQYAFAASKPGEWNWETHPDSIARREAAQVLIREGLGL